jgi:hypothetical protein
MLTTVATIAFVARHFCVSDSAVGKSCKMVQMGNSLCCFLYVHTVHVYCLILILWGVRDGAFGSGTVLQLGRSQFRFPMVSLEFFIDIILSMPSFGRKVKPFAPCRRFEACKRSLNGVKMRNFGKIIGPFSSTVPPFATRALALIGTWRHLAAKVGTSKGRGKQWQTTPKNLPTMQRARAIPVA